MRLTLDTQRTQTFLERYIKIWVPFTFLDTNFATTFLSSTKIPSPDRRVKGSNCVLTLGSFLRLSLFEISFFGPIPRNWKIQKRTQGNFFNFDMKLSTCQSIF